MIQNGKSHRHHNATGGFNTITQSGSSSVSSNEFDVEDEDKSSSAERIAETENESDEDAARKRQLLTCLLSPESNDYLRNRKGRLERLQRNGQCPRVQEANALSPVSRWPTTSPLTASSFPNSAEVAGSCNALPISSSADKGASAGKTPAREKLVMFASDRHPTLNVSPARINKTRDDILTMDKLPDRPSMDHMVRRTEG